MTLTVETAEPASATPAFETSRDAEPFMIIAPEAFSDTLAPYIAHKTAIGLPPALVTLESILAAYTGVDDAEKVRNCIRAKAEQNATAFVLLAGDADMLPVRRCTMTSDPLGQGTLPMEAYFSDLYNGNGEYHNWDTNGDGNFGDYIDDIGSLDLLPDVFTSRIPASTQQELQNALANIIAYETQAQPSDDWFNRVLFAAVDTFNERDHGDTSGIPEGECYAEFLSNGVFGGRETVKLYETDTYPHDEPSTPVNVISRYEPGNGFMAFHCHGAPDCFALVDGCFGPSHAAMLQNGYKLPLTFGFACSTAAFDNELPDWPYGSSAESMPEAMLLNPYGGSIGFVGATRVALASGYSHADYRAMSGAVEYYYFRSYDDGMRTPGMMHAAAGLGYIRHVGINGYYDFYTVAQYAQFGDPSVIIGGVRPEPALKVVMRHTGDMSGDPDGCIEPGESFHLDVAVLNTGGPAADVSAMLSSEDPDAVIVQGIRDLGDIGRLARVETAEPFEVSIDGGAAAGRAIRFRLEYFSGGSSLGSEPVDIFIGNGPWLVLDDWDLVYDSYKNGNVDPGDQVYPSLFIQNNGCRPAENMVITVGSGSPWLEKCATNYGGALGSLPAGYCRESGWAIVDLIIREDCPDNTVIPVSTTVTCDGGFTFDLPFTVTVRDRKGPRMWDYSISSRSLLPGDTVRVRTLSYDVSGIDGIDAIVTAWPDGEPVRIALHDDGAHGDDAAGDGLFGVEFAAGAVPADFIVNLESVDGLGNRLLMKEIAAFSTIPVTTQPVLVIAESPDAEAGAIVADALDNLSTGRFLWDFRFRGAPDPVILEQFRDSVVIWLYGWTQYPDEAERAAMAEALDGGAALLVSGLDVARNASRNGGREWLEERFGVEFVDGNTEVYAVDGIPGHPVTDGLSIRLQKKNATVTFLPDAVRAVSAGEVFMTYRDLPDAAGAVMTRDAGVRTVFLPFALEGVKTSGELEALLQRILPWMQDRPAVPALNLALNREYYRAGDAFLLTTALVNPYPVALAADEYIALDVGGMYWFWPSWHGFPPEVDSEAVMLEPFGELPQTILEFTWPAVGGTAGGIAFRGVLVDPESGTLLGDLESATFGYGP